MQIEEFDPNEYADVGYQIPTAITPERTRLSPGEAFIRTAKIFASAGIGLVLIWFGLTNTGSYYMPASRFGGSLADIFYGWQAGNFMAMVGVVLIYDAVKRTGYL